MVLPADLAGKPTTFTFNHLSRQLDLQIILGWFNIVVFILAVTKNIQFYYL